MKAVTRRRAGSPDQLRIVDSKHPIPRSNEILVKIYATTVTRGDAIMVGVPVFMMYLLRLVMGYRRKKIFGTEFSGEVVELGTRVTRFKIGDQVFGTTTYENQGSHAEYICVLEDGIVALKPENMNYKQAATLPVGAMTALYLLKKNSVEDCPAVMIYGASGSVGSFAVQIAKSFGATVTGVASGANQDLVRSLGADLVLDYSADEFVAHDQQYDLVFDTVGKLSKKDKKRFLKQSGVFISNMASTKELTSLLDEIRELVESDQLTTIIDREYPLEEIIEAYKYVKTGRKKGNVVIRIVD